MHWSEVVRDRGGMDEGGCSSTDKSCAMDEGCNVDEGGCTDKRHAVDEGRNMDEGW